MKKILYINLNNNKVRTIRQYDKYKVNSNGDNLVFEAPPLAGYGIVGLNRLSVYDKNSLSQSGGHFAHFMKCNGYDYIVFEGESNHPVYVYIDKENISINKADHLYNEDYKTIQESLKKELKNDKIEIATIGIAGINKIDFSKIIFRNNKSCGKDGLGKLMAIKNLKAIVLTHQENLTPYDEHKLKRYNSVMSQRINSDDRINWYNENNKCYGCYINCKSSAVGKIQSIGFSLEESKEINKLSNIYGMDSIILARGINRYKKNFDTEIIDFKNFIESIMKNYDSYRPLFIDEDKKIKQSKIKKAGDSSENLGFCKLLLQRNIINDKEAKCLVKCIRGASM